MNPKFSLIVPVFNVAEFLPECLKSIQDQSYKNYELILINDGSTDSSGIICNNFANHHKNTIVIHKKNGGLSSARNTGLKVSKGEFIWFIDSDDWIKKDALDTFIKYITKEKIEILTFLHVTYKNGQIIQKSNDNNLKYDILDGASFIKQSNFCPMVWIHIYKRQFLNKNFLYFNEAIVHEDVDFSLTCYALVKKILFIPHALYFYRIRANSITTKINMIRFKSLIELIRTCNNLKDSDIENSFLENRIYMYMNNYIELLFKGNFKLRKRVELINELKKEKLKFDININEKLRRKARKKLFNINIYLYSIYYYIITI